MHEFEVNKSQKKMLMQRRFHEFQFYPDLARLQEIAQIIMKHQENYEEVPKKLVEEYELHRSKGFHDWSHAEYARFIKAFRRRQVDDYVGIAGDIETKSPEEVKQYLAVFLKRFRETKERDIVIRKFSAKDFDQKNLETLLDYKKYTGYAIFLQDNFYFGRKEYLAMFKQEHERLLRQNGISEEELLKRQREEADGPNMMQLGTGGASAVRKNLTLRLDHFNTSLPRKIVQEQLKYIATAVRAETTLREHMTHLYDHTKYMNKVMQEADGFCRGYQQNLTKKDQEMMQADFEAMRAEELNELKASGQSARTISDDLKFGRGRRAIAKLFK